MSGMEADAESNKSETTRLFRVTKTVLQMLRDRGYPVTERMLSMTREGFVEKYKSDEDATKIDRAKITINFQTDEDNMMVFFCTDEKLSTDSYKLFAEVMESNKANKGIFILRSGISPNANKAIDELNMGGTKRIEKFRESELVVNITEHELVPKHEVLSDDEKKELLMRYRVKESQLPKMLASDAVARYFGLRSGKVVKIIRRSETAGRYVTYRLVV
mmetsp:Transcript_9302/g.25301  ORF Transcript_9302/g.25301 Transcript_9302/m.25301 type:complete len:218 (-) Transcript_9302:716-1369(-)